MNVLVWTGICPTQLERVLGCVNALEPEFVVRPFLHASHTLRRRKGMRLACTVEVDRKPHLPAAVTVQAVSVPYPSIIQSNVEVELLVRVFHQHNDLSSFVRN